MRLTDEERDLIADVWDEETTASPEPFYPVVARIIAARLLKAGQFADLLHKAHAVCEEVVMDTPEERALHQRHVDQMRDIDSALLGALMRADA